MIKRFFSSEGGVIDWSIIFVVMMLALIGLASLYVAGVHDTVGVNVWRMVIMRFDSEQLWRVAPYIFGLGVFLMVAVLIFYSRAYYANTGGKSWFAIGPLTFQPSEVMKPAFIIMLARVISQHNLENP
ncbi:MAG: FtsW/RodA/SpoVE family cell cycle protein, partial [Weissella confusa]|nr:FtsW/RodA/SpoVE family cell cycle protein [Weissella confusa]